MRKRPTSSHVRARALEVQQGFARHSGSCSVRLQCLRIRTGDVRRSRVTTGLISDWLSGKKNEKYLWSRAETNEKMGRDSVWEEAEPVGFGRERSKGSWCGFGCLVRSGGTSSASWLTPRSFGLLLRRRLRLPRLRRQAPLRRPSACQ